ncbi:MAG: DinB family protein [Anaerolineales bacterium]|nr:DinB family protein [Anaerolineales bacterium]
MELIQKQWNKEQKEFRKILLGFDQHQRALELFMRQHAMLHSAEMDPSITWSFEDEVLSDLDDAQVRRIPQNCEHSIAWLIWHIARIEDVAMNMLVAGEPQILHQGMWFERMKVADRDTGNVMAEEGVADLSNTVDLKELRGYRVAVGRRTREIVNQLSAEDLKRKVSPSRLQKVMDVGAVIEAARGLIEYWGKRNIAGLLLMPATRHNFVHLNEALRLKSRRR